MIFYIWRKIPLHKEDYSAKRQLDGSMSSREKCWRENVFPVRLTGGGQVAMMEPGRRWAEPIRFALCCRSDRQ
jgi:hypothetical protein